MNTDLGARAMSGDEITAVVAAWRAGAISRGKRARVSRRRLYAAPLELSNVG